MRESVRPSLRALLSNLPAGNHVIAYLTIGDPPDRFLEIAHEVLAAFYADAFAARGPPADGPAATWERLPPSTVTPDEQQAAMVAAGREAWERPLECR